MTKLRIPVPTLGVLAGAALTLGAIAPAGAAPLHHDIDLTLDPGAGRIEAVDRLTLSAGIQSLRLDPALTLEEARAGDKPVAVDRRGDRLVLTVPEGSGPVTLRYGGRLPGFTAGTGLALDGEGAFLPGLGGWLPDPARASEEPPTWRLSVRVPAPYVAVATGRLVEEGRDAAGYHAVFEESRSVEEPSVFAGPWTVEERMAGDLRLRLYRHPEQTGLADGYLGLSEQAIAAGSARIGAYPFDGFSIVSVPPPVGLGFPGLTAIGRAVLPLPFIRSQSLTHEIMHNWWGNGVRVGEGGNWAEGLTTYMADYAAARTRGADAARAMRLDWLRDFAALPAERDRPLTAFLSKTHDASQIVGYGKAAMLFHMLEAEIGHDAFDAGIRRFWSAHAFQTAGWSDLRHAFETASGRDLGGMFSQWVERRGAPMLTLVDARGDGDGVRLTLRQEADAPYVLTVPVRLETAAGVEEHGVQFDSRQATLRIPSKAEVRAVAVDPDFDLFRRLAPGEAPPILRDVTLRPGADRVIAADGEAAEAARMLTGRLIDGSGRESGGRESGGGVAPLLLVGTDAAVARELEARGLPPVPAELAGQGSARVWVSRAADGQTALVVSGADAEALRALVRPLPHYGRQSWLVFEGAKAVDRGVWAVGDSPLRRMVGR
ncbi:M1 family peptidase [Azospirillum oryzae]|uniref:M1 family peptidase n=1 Tax=Azospirillum oryzae TaxID=286727 RepID=A0A6N1AV53_9PROT|nr:M1 family aminopeptidase [Azospirillum oryzae]KAA0589869.1 M1 family metallopeptidase [Azospirillum oryzae]QKS53164.1 M1 family peptidase [Azospirillum oryzae]